MKKILTLLFIFTLLLGACTQAAPPTEAPAPAEPTKAPAAEPTEEPEPVFEPVELVDSLNNSVTVETKPERIVSLAPSITESLYAIGAGDLLVGRTDYDNYPEAVLELPSVGGFSADSISIETIISLEPDLVIGGSSLQGDVIASLNESGIPSVTFESGSVEEITNLLLLLGEATENQEKAGATVAEMQARIQAVTDIVETIPEDERATVYYEIWHEPLMSTSNKTFIGELINLAGGINIFGDLEESYPVISAESLLEANPTAIIGPSSHGDQLTEEAIASREGWQDIAAVKNKNIHILDEDIISRPGPRVVDALEALAQALYPDYFNK